MSKYVKEKRRYPRKSLEKIAEVLDNDTGLSIGILEDVSKGGFSVITDQAVRPSETRSVTLVLPGPQDTPHKVSLTAECIWCQTIAERANFAVGFALISIKDQDEVALNYYIRDYQVIGQEAGELEEV
ncbi:MAG: PilZ domain-containing protein [Endozoicomonas sp.]